MSDIAPTLGVEHPPPPPAPRSVWARRRIAIVTAGTVAVALVAGAGWWLTHPRALTEAGGTITITTFAGQTVSASPVAEIEREITVSSVTARIVENSAGADVRVVLCDENAGATPSAGQEALDGRCGRVEEVGGQRLGVGDGRFLLFVATSRTEGRVLVDGFDVSYRDGVRFGEQHSGVTVDVRVSAGEGSGG